MIDRPLWSLRDPESTWAKLKSRIAAMYDIRSAEAREALAVKRREFHHFFGGVTEAWPDSAPAQQPVMPVVWKERRQMARRFKRCAFVTGAVLIAVFLSVEGRAMSLDEIVGELKKSNPEAARLITSYPVDIRESQPDFLGGAAYLEITVQMPYHPTFLRLVYRPGKRLYWPGGVDELERLRTELGIAIKDAGMALRYAQWRLGHTEGSAFWLVSSVEQIPFITGLPLFGKDVEKAKAVVAGKIAAPTAEHDRDGFTVTQFAVLRGSLVRYNARVERDATWSCSKTQLVADLPVIEVAPAIPPTNAACP
jgi:hypothetical protein